MRVDKGLELRSRVPRVPRFSGFFLGRTATCLKTKPISYLSMKVEAGNTAEPRVGESRFRI
jgi:hypothetical protein